MHPTFKFKLNYINFKVKVDLIFLLTKYCFTPQTPEGIPKKKRSRGSSRDKDGKEKPKKKKKKKYSVDEDDVFLHDRGPHTNIKLLQKSFAEGSAKQPVPWKPVKFLIWLCSSLLNMLN